MNPLRMTPIAAAMYLTMFLNVAVLWQAPVEASDLAAAISGDAHPLSKKLSQFDPSWRRINIHGTMNVSGNTSINLTGSSANSVSQNNNLIGATGSGRGYLTKGALVQILGRTFVVAYHLPTSSMDLGTLLQVAATKTVPSSNALTPDTEIPLSLLDLSQVGALEDVRVFNLDREISESTAAAKALESLLKAEAAKQTQQSPQKPKSASSPVAPSVATNSPAPSKSE